MFSGTHFKAAMNLWRYYFGVADGGNPMASELIIDTRVDAPSFNIFDVDKKFNLLFGINIF